jgi:hypothetical protein
VLAPATAGTGSSVKLIEALCAGKPIVATSLALRGLPRAHMIGEDLHVHDAAADFADALTRLSGQPHAAPMGEGANAALYDRLFSNARYFAALDAVVSDLSGSGAVAWRSAGNGTRHEAPDRVSGAEESLAPAQNLRIKPTRRPWMSTWSGPKMRVS